MLNLPEHIILWDTEYTSWEGAQARDWGGPHEYRELVQIGAVRFNTKTLTEGDYLLLFIKPEKNPMLSEYFIKLTGVTQEDVDTRGVSFAEASAQFQSWISDTPCYAYGHDKHVLDLNYELHDVPNPYPEMPQQFFDVREVFKTAGINTANFMSSTITEAFGVESPYRGHDAVGDARTIGEGLELLALGTPILDSAR